MFLGGQVPSQNFRYLDREMFFLGFVGFPNTPSQVCEVLAESLVKNLAETDLFAMATGTSQD